jgi:D-amino-acid dehydrogenase
VATLVIGGGLAGLATAQVLAERGEQVRVLELLDGVGLETSFANAGLLTPSMPEPWNGPGAVGHLAGSVFGRHSSIRLNVRAIPSLLTWGISFLRNSSPDRFHSAVDDNFRLARYSRERTAELTERLGLRYDFLDGGSLCVFRERQAMAERQAICDRLRNSGMNSREVDRDEIVEIEPALAGTAAEFIGGIWLPDDATGDAHLYCRELERTIVGDGGVVETGVRVSGLSIRNGVLFGVDTDHGRIEADRVVVAAGTRSPDLLRTTGRSLPIKPAKGHSLTFEYDDPGELPGVGIVDDSAHAVVSPFGERIRVVGFAEFAGFDKSIGRRRLDQLFGVLESLLPHIAAQVDRDQGVPWAGLRPMSADGRPHIGPAGIDGLYVNSGHGALGWTMAMGSAQLLVDQMLGDRPAIDPRPFLPFRR